MSSIRRLGFALPLALSAGLAGCVSDTFSPTPRPTADFANIGYATWSDDEPSYRLYPGDELDVSIASAPELNKIALVQPDGRVSLPLIDPVMVADLSVVDAQAALKPRHRDRRPLRAATAASRGVSTSAMRLRIS